MSKSYKYHRSRKTLTLEICELKLVDCVKKLEQAILDDSVDPKRVQTIQAATYALSNAIGRILDIKEARDIEARLEKLEQQLNKQS